MQPAPQWTSEQLTLQLAISTEHFRRQRMEEPLEAYLEHFETYQGRIEELLETTVDLIHLDRVAREVFSNTPLLEVIRYLPGPPISTDDLKVLTEASSLTAKRFNGDPELVSRVVQVIMVGLDRRRFPWIGEDREPDESELAAAVTATAALMAVQRLGTTRRKEGKSAQEQRVEDALLASGFTKVARRTVRTAAEFPNPGEFCAESTLGNRKADFVARLWDNRLMAIECKVSNSATNSVKRLNNDAAAKAEAWRDDFGRTQIVPAAVLSGVYKLHNLEDAQRRGLTLFWAHDLIEMIRWVESTRTP
jgi:hypothetical protein